MLAYRLMIEVFLFLSVFDKWKSGKVTVVIFQWRWVILSRGENPDVCVRVRCAVAVTADCSPVSFVSVILFVTLCRRTVSFVFKTRSREPFAAL